MLSMHFVLLHLKIVHICEERRENFLSFKKRIIKIGLSIAEIDGGAVLNVAFFKMAF